MEIEVCDNIRRLRREKNMTQEMLAEILSVTPQAVSKWERAERYPDITMLPAIANYFGVSVDMLLGNDKTRNEEKIRTYLADFRNLSVMEKGQDAFCLSQKAYEEYPYDCRIMMLYVNALKLYGPAGSDEEIERICKTVLNQSDDPKLCADASYFLCGFRSAEDRMAFLNKFIDYGEDWNWFKIYPRDSEEGRIMMQHEICDAWWHLNQIIYEYGDLFNEDPSRKISHETKIALIRKCEAIFRAFFDENDLGEYSFYLGQYNEFLAQEYAALHMEEETLTHLEKAIDGWTAYRNLPEQYEYRSVLYDQRPYSKPNVSGTYCDLSRLKDKLDRDETYSFLRRNYRFQELYKKLS